MTKHTTYLTILFLFISIATNAQNGKLSGSIKTLDGRPADLVNVAIKGTTKATTSNENGNYTIKNIKPGAYIIIASFIGLEKNEQSVIIEADKTLILNFVLKENSAQLNEVFVSSRNTKNKVIADVAKMPLKNLENPQVYSSVSSEIIKQQGITSYDDIMRNVPGISRTWESTGRAGDGASYFALRGFEAQANLTNGLPGLTSGNLDVSNIEEVQVMKGPSATLFGASFYGYGGIINTITKKPYFNLGGEVAYNVGSFGLNRVTADINTPLSKTQKIALRLNTAYHTENSFQNAGFKRSFFVAPAITYEVNDRLKFDVMAEVLQEKRVVAPVFFQSDRVHPLPFKTVEDMNLNVKESFTNNDLPIKNPRFNLQAQMNYKISDKWHSQTVFSTTRAKSDGYYTYIWDDPIPDSNFPQYFHIENNVTKTFDIQQNFNGDFKLFGLRNRLLVGLDYFSRSVVDKGSGWGIVRYVTPQSTGVDYTFVDPSDPGSPGVFYPAVPVLTKQFVDSKLTPFEGEPTRINNRSYSAYASDVINFTPQLSAMLSLRVDNFVVPADKATNTKEFNQLVLSHKLGLVYQPIIDKVSVFANYMNAFINKEPSQIYDASGNPTGEVQSFKPEHANQWEIGVKTNLFNDRLSATVSYYDIRVNNRVYTDQFFNSVQGGKVQNKGFEIDINANITEGLNLIAGYSHNSSKVVSGSASDFYNEPGRAAGGQGPSDQANLWATYRFTRGSLKNFGVGLGGNYAGEYKVIDNSVTGVFILPGYTLINSSLFYNAKHYRVNFNLNNITNKQYYIGYWSINPQRLRNFNLSLAYKF